jgi:glycosyltransferase 2 family protein
MQLMIGSRRLSIEAAAISTLVAVAVLLAVAAFVIGAESLLRDLKALGVGFLLLFAALMLWQVGCRFLRWFFLARALGLALRPCEALLFYGAGLGMTLTPGRIGETLRLWFIHQRLGVPYRRLAALYVGDRIADATAYLVMLAAASAITAESPAIAWAPLLVLVAVIGGIVRPELLLGLLGFGCRIARRGRPTLLWLRRVVRNTARLFRPTIFLPALVIGFVGWFAAPLVLSLALSRMGIDLGLIAAAAIYAASALTGGATMLPGGLGGTEVAMVALLVAAGVPLEAAVSATVATRIIFLWLPVALGFLILPLALSSVRKLAVAS